MNFKRVPMNTTTEAVWYGPWNALLNHLFPNKLDEPRRGGFVVSPQYILDDSLSPPEVFFVISRDTYPCLVVDIKPPHHLRSSTRREAAYKQLVKHLRELYEDYPMTRVRTPVIYGIQVMGPLFMTMKLNCNTACIFPGPCRKIKNHPAYIPNKDWSRFPRYWWKYNVTKVVGAIALMKLASEIIDLTEMYEAAIPRPSCGRTLTLAEASRVDMNLFDHDIPGPGEPLPGDEGWDVSSWGSSAGSSRSGEDSRETEQERCDSLLVCS